MGDEDVLEELHLLAEHLDLVPQPLVVRLQGVNLLLRLGGLVYSLVSSKESQIISMHDLQNVISMISLQTEPSRYFKLNIRPETVIIVIPYSSISPP